MFVPGIFVMEQVNDLEAKQWELLQKVNKNELVTKSLTEDIKDLKESLKIPFSQLNFEVNLIVEALKKSSFAPKIPAPLITELEELRSKINNPKTTGREKAKLIYLVTENITELAELNISPQNDYEKMLEKFRVQLHTASVEGLQDWKKIEDERERLLQDNRRQELINSENGIRMQQLDRLREKITQYYLIWISCFCSGLLIAFGGFYSWYTKVQIVQDKLLKKKWELENH